MAEKALAQFHLDPAVRDLRSLSFPTKSKRFSEMKEKLRGFIREFNEEFSDEMEGDELMQLNLQLFKLSES